MSTLSKLNTLFNRSSRITGVALIFTGAIWGLLQMNHIPEYGDTREYIELAQAASLQLDPYRTLLFPLILRVAFKTAPHYFQIPLYLFQLLLLGFALRHLVKTAELYFRAPLRSNLLWLSLFFLPIVLHFNVTVLSDGIALGLLIFFTSLLIRLLLLKRDALWDYGFYFCAFVLMALSRSEKIYIAAGSALIGILFMVFVKKNKLYQFRKSILTSFLALATVFTINSYTQTISLSEPPPDLTYSFLYRALYPRFEKVYPLMPEAVRSKLSIEDARLYDSHPNANKGVMKKICGTDWTCAHPYADQMLATVLRHQGLAVMSSIIRDMIYYSAAPWVWITAPWTGLGHYDWTYSRFSMQSPKLSWLYLNLGSLLVIVLTLSLVARLVRTSNASRNFQHILPFAFLVLCPGLANSGLFALMNGHPFHIRYAIPSYFLAVFLMVVLFSLPKSPQERLTHEK
ncbi:hypothetical protein WDW86_15090 [Bdellovibrionota bacterium FG-2]